MRKNKQRILAALLSLVLVLALAPAGWAVDLTTENTIAVEPAGKQNTTEEEATDYVNDLSAETTHMVYDLYRVATAIEDPMYDTYGFKLIDPFTSLANNTDKPGVLDTTDFTASDWNSLNQEVAKLLFPADADGKTQAATTPVLIEAPIQDNQKILTYILSEATEEGGEAKRSNAGLYLLIAHNQGEEGNPATVDDYLLRSESGNITTTVKTNLWVYTYEPQLIAIPTKADSEGGPKTSDEGEWINNLTVVLKPTRESRLGDLKIVKTLDKFAGPNPASFVFKIEWNDGTQGQVRYAEITFNAKGTREYLIEKAFPIGGEVTVTEVYTGLQYSAKSGSEITKPIVAAGITEFNFVNDHTGPGGGYGVTNRFTAVDKNSLSWEQIDDSGSTQVTEDNINSEDSQETGGQ